MTDWNQERAERFSLWVPLATYERAKLEAARAVVGPDDSPGSGAYVSVGFERWKWYSRIQNGSWRLWLRGSERTPTMGITIFEESATTSSAWFPSSR